MFEVGWHNEPYRCAPRQSFLYRIARALFQTRLHIKFNSTYFMFLVFINHQHRMYVCHYNCKEQITIMLACSTNMYNRGWWQYPNRQLTQSSNCDSQFKVNKLPFLVRTTYLFTSLTSDPINIQIVCFALPLSHRHHHHHRRRAPYIAAAACSRARCVSIINVGQYILDF